MSKKHTLEYVKEFFEEQGCELLEKEYINCMTKVKYKCSCGNIDKITFDHFQRGHRCKKCGIKRRSEKRRHDHKYVEQYFENRGCKLLEKEYKNNNTLMKYQCSCGHISKISFNNFFKGQQCQKCGMKKKSGKTHYNYNPNLTDEDRMDRRSFPEYKKWVKDVYKRDKWTCQKCRTRKDNNGKYKKINAHHIEGYAENRSLRTDVSNGIVLCRCCHDQFHYRYGKNNSNRKQLNEFLTLSISDYFFTHL